MKLLIGRFICALTKHRRGKRVSELAVKCPRCGSEWPREKKAKPA
jgi:hypothetical protein